MVPLTRQPVPVVCARYTSLRRAGASFGHCSPFNRLLTGAVRRCPHVTEVCRNSALHPRHDVLYMKNAEGNPLELTYHSPRSGHSSTVSVQIFNGCGFCKVCCIFIFIHDSTDGSLFHQSGRGQILHEDYRGITTQVGPAAVGPLALVSTGWCRLQIGQL